MPHSHRNSLQLAESSPFHSTRQIHPSQLLWTVGSSPGSHPRTGLKQKHILIFCVLWLQFLHAYIQLCCAPPYDCSHFSFCFIFILKKFKISLQYTSKVGFALRFCAHLVLAVSFAVMFLLHPLPFFSSCVPVLLPPFQYLLFSCPVHSILSNTPLPAWEMSSSALTALILDALKMQIKTKVYVGTMYVFVLYEGAAFHSA